MAEPFERGESQVDDPSVRATRHIGHEPDPAGVTFDRTIRPGRPVRARPVVGSRHGSPPGGIGMSNRM
jgi:hypothetical protein